MLDEASLLLPMALDVIGVGAAFLTTPGLIASFEFELADFAHLERGTRPGVAFLLVQEMPDQDGKLVQEHPQQVWINPSAESIALAAWLRTTRPELTCFRISPLSIYNSRPRSGMTSRRD